MLQTLLTQAATIYTNFLLGYGTAALMSQWCLHRLPSTITFASSSLFSLSVCAFIHTQDRWIHREPLACAWYLIDCVTCHLPAQLFCICLLMLSAHEGLCVTLRLSEMPQLSMLSSRLFPAWLVFAYVVLRSFSFLRIMLKIWVWLTLRVIMMLPGEK